MTDHRADRWLMPLVGLVVSAAAVVVAWALVRAPWSPTSALLHVAFVAAMVAVAAGCTVTVARRQQQVSATSAAVVLAVAVLPAPWVVLTTAAGIGAAKALRQRDLRKVLFNTAKDTLASAAGAGAAWWLGWRPGLDTMDVDPGAWPRLLLALVAAAAAYAVVEEALVAPVVALATGRRWWQVTAADADLRTGLRLVDLVLGVGAVILIDLDGRLLAALPPTVLAVHSGYAWRIRAREDRLAWRRLSDAVAELAGGDIDRVATVGAMRAAELVGAAEVEVDYPTPAGDRRVRAADGQISYRGPATGPALDGVELGLPGGATPAWLRLRRRATATLTGRDRDLLAAYGRALAGALDAAGRVDQLGRLAYTDALTGLANRRRLVDVLAELLADDARRRRVVVGLLDLDGFKQVNDTHGHDVGDQVITACAGRLLAAVPDAVVVARLGGDEFALVLVDVDQLDMVAREVLATLTAPLAVAGVPVTIGASLGWAAGTDHGILDELMRAADDAMYAAKAGGGGNAYAPGLTSRGGGPTG
ncbi:GGDEF domain-containing protein [Polymorphospora sp. NPDC050346]|uniref:GGDEF domain-containing protein n=1 Tax=Polymorphospora sp. NPDC050346 TaxID=3155780 RepID=UPI0033DC875E